MNLEFTAKLWMWDGPAAWYFVTVPPEQAGELKAVSGFFSTTRGMIPVAVRIGETEWNTSVFPGSGGYDLPVKAAVRKTEGLKEGDEVFVQLQVR